jgi:hypothetical protein
MKNKNTTTMKKSVLFFAAMFILTIGGLAQGTYNVVIFSEDGLPFYAYVNGIRQNDKPETNIRVTGLNSSALNVRVEFQDQSLPKLKQNMMPEPGFEHTINIRRNMKKELKMAYFGRVALADAPQGGATNIAYHTSENAVDNGTSNTSQTTNTDYSNNTNFNTGNGGVSITTTTTSTQISTNPNNVSINMGGNGINVNMSGNGIQNSTTTTVTTTSSTAYSSNSTSGSTSNYSTGGTTNSGMSQSTSNYSGCSIAMSPTAYDKMKQSVEEKPFSDTKMSTAKIATKNNCLSSAQIKGICGLFSMDDDKLAYAKYAYDYCVDKSNYYTVSEIFSFSTTTDSLNKFLESK